MLQTAFKLARPHFWLLSVIPSACGVVAAGGELLSLKTASVAFVLSALSCLAEVVNNYIDFETDQEQTRKQIGWLMLAGGSGLRSNPVGKRGLLLTIIALTTAAGAVSVWLGGLNLLLLFVPGWFMAVGYSVPPFCFKERGIGGTLDMILSRGMLPFIFGWAVMAPVTVEVVVIGAFLSLLNFGSATVPHLADFEEDSKLGIDTFPVRHGFQTAARTAGIGVALSLVVLAGLRLTGVHLNLLVWILVSSAAVVAVKLWRLQPNHARATRRVQLFAMATFLIGPFVFL